MKPEHVQPFVEAAIRTFDTLMGTALDAGEPRPGEGIESIHDVSGIVGLSGADVTGALVLSFPEEVALAAVSRMIGEEMAGLDQDVVDGIGELANIVAGNAKGDLGEMGLAGLSMTMPTVVVGPRHKVFRIRDARSYFVPFESEIGSICLQIYMKTG